VAASSLHAREQFEISEQGDGGAAACRIGLLCRHVEQRQDMRFAMP
jgi:hypothetical protein